MKKINRIKKSAILALSCALLGLGGCCTPSVPALVEQQSAQTESILENQMNASYYFRFDKSTLQEEAKQSLNQFAAFLLANPQARVNIEGYADIRGGSAYNKALGLRRAEAIADYLQSKGIAENRVAIVSFGAEKLADLGKTSDAHARNRRAEISVIV